MWVSVCSQEALFTVCKYLLLSGTMGLDLLCCLPFCRNIGHSRRF